LLHGACLQLLDSPLQGATRCHLQDDKDEYG